MSYRPEVEAVARAMAETEGEQECWRDYTKAAQAAITAYLTSQWRPISEAPKDGTSLILAWQAVVSAGEAPRWFQTIGSWDAEFQDSDTEEVGAWTDYTVASWQYEEYRSLQPTHFAPLPPPPVTTQREDGADPALVASPSSPSVPLVSTRGFDPGEGGEGFLRTHMRHRGFAFEGETVRFLAENGHDSELQAASELFRAGQVLTVSRTTIGDWSSTYEFEGIDGRFNTVMFAPTASRIEAPSGVETVQQGSTEGESPAGEAGTPNPSPVDTGTDKLREAAPEDVERIAQAIADDIVAASGKPFSSSMIARFVRLHLSSTPPSAEAPTHREKLLGEWLGKVLVHAGMIRDDMPMTGPQLLCAAETFCQGPAEAKLRTALEKCREWFADEAQYEAETSCPPYAVDSAHGMVDLINEALGEAKPS